MSKLNRVVATLDGPATTVNVFDSNSYPDRAFFAVGGPDGGTAYLNREQLVALATAALAVAEILEG